MSTTVGNVDIQLGRLALAYRSAMIARFGDHDEFAQWGLRPPSIGTLKVIAHSAPISQREVSERLGISPRTVKAHCDVLRQKLGVRRRRQLPIAYRSLTGDDPLAQGLDPCGSGD